MVAARGLACAVVVRRILRVEGDRLVRMSAKGQGGHRRRLARTIIIGGWGDTAGSCQGVPFLLSDRRRGRRKRREARAYSAGGIRGRRESESERKQGGCARRGGGAND
jgi:hypothetical protein